MELGFRLRLGGLPHCALPSILAVPSAVSVASVSSWVGIRNSQFSTGSQHGHPWPSRGFSLTGKLVTMALASPPLAACRAESVLHVV